MTIDIDRLREELKQECYGAYFGGGFGEAMIESLDLERASPVELIKEAERKEIDLRKFQI